MTRDKLLEIKDILYTYRYDIIGLIVMSFCIQIFFSVLTLSGQVVFSDIDFPYSSRHYYDQIIGIWNHRYNTTAMLNTPRLLSLLPAYIVSIIAGFNGSVLLKAFLLQNIYVSGITFYLFLKRLLRIYYNPKFYSARIAILVIGSLYYALNPWVVFRIQHIYLLVGYSLFPFVLLQFFKLYDHKFQAVVITDYNPLTPWLYKENVKDVAIMAFAISVSAGAIHYFFYTAFLIGALLVLLVIKYLIIYRKESLKKRWYFLLSMIKKSSFVVVLIIGFSAFWLIVYILSIVLGVEASQNNVNVLDTYTSFSKNSDILHVLYLISYWWPMISFEVFDIGFYIGGGVILVLVTIGFLSSFKHNHIVLFLGLLGLMLSILATGVYYTPIAPLFLKFVELPIIGSMFRDPNKLVGLLALCLGVAYVFGMDIVLEAIDHIKHQGAIKFVFVCVSFVALALFLWPMKKGFVDAYYKPVEQPSAYSALNEFLTEEDIGYAIYLPLADEMLKNNKIASPYWNMINGERQKSTGDFHVYNSEINTLFQFEGNDVAVGYYLRYLQYLLDEGRTDDIADYITILGSDVLIYHDEYVGQEERQDQNKKVIEADSRFNIIYENEIFTVYQLNEKIMEKETLYNRYIYSTKGYELLNTLLESSGFDLNDSPIIYGYQTPNIYETINSLDGFPAVIDTSSQQDLVMSFIPDQYMLYPFQWVNEGNPYLKWSKTYATNIDWSWLLSSQGIHNRGFSFDQNGGLAVTLASNALDVFPYQRKHLVGETVIDFDQMLSEDLFFVADNEELFSIESNPYIGETKYQTIQGVLAKGEPKDIWQVAKSGVFQAKENTPYRFRLLISGRFIQSLHFKVRFYDKDMNELGIQYVVAPEEVPDFDTMSFYGEVISPPKTVWMRLDLLSHQKPTSKSYWWIHDISVEDLTQYVAKNKIEGDYSVDKDGLYRVLLRSYTSHSGGDMVVTIDGTSYEVSTKRDLNGFEWLDLGELYLSAGDKNIQLTAKGGFLCINSIAIIPKSVLEDKELHVEQWIRKNLAFVAVESSNEMAYTPQLQSDKTYSYLSMGKGLSIAKGEITHNFDISKEGDYIVEPSWIFPYEDRGSASLIIEKDDGTKEAFNYKKDTLEGEDDKIHLKKGKYKVTYTIDSMARNYTSIHDLSPFYGEAIFLDKVIDDPYMSDCSECEKINMSMMRHAIEGEVLEISYDQTCSCDWYIYSSDLLEVAPKQEWYIRFEARSEEVTKRHGKMIFMDENGIPIEITYISEVEEQDKKYWYDYEQIVEVPEEAVTAYFQFWTRGNKENNGVLQVKNLYVQRYSDFITLDHLLLYEDQRDLMPSKSYIINTMRSPNPNWKSNSPAPQLKLNGVTQGYLLTEEMLQEGNFKSKITLSPIYNGGLVVFVITCIGLVVYVRRRKHL